MSEHKHTPGPWEYLEFFDYVSIHAKGKEIAQVLTDDKSDEQRANASLVMAAPELLEACEAACDRCMSISIAPQCETCKIGNAIKMAKGELPMNKLHFGTMIKITEKDITNDKKEEILKDVARNLDKAINENKDNDKH